jgi:hypothetical protein
MTMPIEHLLLKTQERSGKHMVPFYENEPQNRKQRRIKASRDRRNGKNKV